MTPYRVKSLLAIALVLIGCALTRAAGPAEAVRLERRFDQYITLSKLGDATVRLRWELPPGEYLALQQRVSTIRKVPVEKGKERIQRVGTAEGLAHYFNLDNLGVAAGDINVTLDDSKKQITATFAIAGWVRTTSGSDWTLEFLDDARWYDPLNTAIPPIAGAWQFTREKSPEGSVRFGSVGASNNVHLAIHTEVKLPEGATRAKLAQSDNGRWAISYRLPRPATTGEKDGEVSFDIQPRREVLPALHKLYGNPTWPTYYLARTKFSNSTTDTVENVRIRCRVATSAGQTAWSDWEETASVVYPGQSVQYPLHAVLDARALLLLASQEHGRLSVELEYMRGEKKIVKARSARLAILGRNDVVATLLSGGALKSATFHHNFQEYPVVITAFVTPNDPVIKDLKGQLSTHIGGPATDNDAGAFKFARAIYDYFRVNVSYSSPSATLSEDGTLVQHVNYPRNVLEAGSGTCIDLAVTYASIAEAAGLRVGVCTLPGHALPYIVLPQSKRVLFIEVVGCAKGTLEGSLSFSEALRRGNARAQSNTFVMANLSLMRKYVSAPELPNIELANPLKAWGRRLPPSWPEVFFGAVKVRHNVKTNGSAGMQFSFPVTIANGKDQDCLIRLAVRDAAGKPYLGKDGKQHLITLTVKPDSDQYSRQMTIAYPYDNFAAAEDGNWHERRLEVWAFSPQFKDYTAAQIIADRMLIQRVAARTDDTTAVARSILFRTQVRADAKGNKGIELLIKNVELGSTLASGASTVVSPVGGPKQEVFKKSDGAAIEREVSRIGPMKLWFADDELVKLGSGAVKGLRINFRDKAKREWLLPNGVTVSLNR